MQHEKHTKKTRKKSKLANLFLVKQTQIIMLFKLEMESLDFRQWQNKREKGPMKSMVRQKSTQPCKRERKKNQRNPKTPLISVPYDQCCDTEVNPARADKVNSETETPDFQPIGSLIRRPKRQRGGWGKFQNPRSCTRRVVIV